MSIYDDSYYTTWQTTNRTGIAVGYNWLQISFFMHGIIPLGGEIMLSQYLTVAITTTYDAEGEQNE